MQTGLNRSLLLLAEFGAAGAKHLDAVVVWGVVAGAHHQAAAATELADRSGHSGRGAQAEIQHLAPRRREPGRQGRHQHRPAAAGITTEQDRATLRQHLPAPVAQLQGQSRRDLATHPAADAIGAEGCSALGQRRSQWRGSQGERSRLGHYNNAPVAACRVGRGLKPAQRQRRGHQAQTSSSITAQSNTAPTTQPGSNRSGQNARNSINRPAKAHTCSSRRR